MLLRLTLKDGKRVDVNTDAIAYIERLDTKETEKPTARTKIVLLSGQELIVRQTSNQIAEATGKTRRDKEEHTVLPWPKSSSVKTANAIDDES